MRDRERPAALRDPFRGGDGRRSTAAGGGSSPSSGSSSCSTRRSRSSAQAGQKVEGQVVKLDPEFVLEQVAKAPREFDLQARNPERTVHIGGDHMVFSSVYGCPFVREGTSGASATMRRLREPRPAVAGVPAARLAGRDDLRAERPAARLAPSRHGVRAADALRQAVHGLGHVGTERRRHDRDGRDRLRRREAIERTPRDDLADQRQLAAPLRRPDARRAARVRARQPGARRSRRSC